MNDEEQRSQYCSLLLSLAREANPDMRDGLCDRIERVIASLEHPRAPRGRRLHYWRVKS